MFTEAKPRLISLSRKLQIFAKVISNLHLPLNAKFCIGASVGKQHDL